MTLDSQRKKSCWLCPKETKVLWRRVQNHHLEEEEAQDSIYTYMASMRREVSSASQAGDLPEVALTWARD
jgi:hypothetical protein